MGGGNGAKAAQKRERNNKDKTKAGSQKASNEASKTIQCETCKTMFSLTLREKALTEHAENKHGKTLKDCFPNWTAQSAK